MVKKKELYSPAELELINDYILHTPDVYALDSLETLSLRLAEITKNAPRSIGGVKTKVSRVMKVGEYVQKKRETRKNVIDYCAALKNLLNEFDQLKFENEKLCNRLRKLTKVREAIEEYQKEDY